MARAGILGSLSLALLLAGCGGTPHGKPVRFTIPRGSGISATADTLAARHVVSSRLLFRIYAQIQGLGRTLHPGVYEARAGTAYSELVEKLATGDVVKEKLVVPEGWTAEQIAARIARVSGVPADSVSTLLFDTATAGRMHVPGPTLEGYLYPATYVFPLGTPSRDVAAALVRRYRQVWTPTLRARADSAGLSEREVVTLASIVEKEAKVWAERDTIAAVYRNRLRLGMPLQADPTVQYALGEHQQRLLYSDIREVADNPYNTYTHPGLPPGPIASPSEGAIHAVLYPAGVDYLYFVARPNGTHAFTRSLAQHNAAKQRIRRQQTAAAKSAKGKSP
jgi:UPF0755 protein